MLEQAMLNKYAFFLPDELLLLFIPNYSCEPGGEEKRTAIIVLSHT